MYREVVVSGLIVGLMHVEQAERRRQGMDREKGTV
jgi:hypothetical protein